MNFVCSILSDDFNVSAFEDIDKDDFNWGEFLGAIINNKTRKENFIVPMME